MYNGWDPLWETYNKEVRKEEKSGDIQYTQVYYYILIIKDRDVRVDRWTLKP